MAVNEGSLFLGKGPGATALPGNVTVGDGTGGVNADQLRLVSGEQIADAAAVTVASSGLIALESNPETIGSLAGTGNVHLTFGTVGLLVVGANNASTTFGGVIANGGVPAGQVNKVGTGTLTLTGANTYSGLTRMQGGTLLVNGSLAKSTVTLGGGAR